MKRLLCALLAGTALLSLSGCRSVFEREYYYEAPYAGDFGTRSDRATEIRNYSMLKTALTNMITNHTEKAEFRFSSYNGNINEDLAAACFEIKSDHPLGAYAVESLSYDTSYVVSYYMANIYIGYKRTAEELSSIVYTSSVADFDDSVCRAADGFEPGLVIRCFAPGIDETHILKLIKRHYYDEPTVLIAEPKADVTGYPADSASSIFDIRFHYGFTKQRSEDMASELRKRLRETVGEMSETEQPKLALEAARYLSGANTNAGMFGLYADTVYGALVYGNADSKGLALAYRALCDELGIECVVVEGGFGSIGTETHYWNIIGLEDAYYHVDISAMPEDPTIAFLLSDEMLWGRCIWETEDYPVCDGPLTYAAVAGIPDSETEAPSEEGQDPTAIGENELQEPPGPEEPTPPQESPEPEEPTPPQESLEPEELTPPQNDADTWTEPGTENGEKTP